MILKYLKPTWPGRSLAFAELGIATQPICGFRQNVGASYQQRLDEIEAGLDK
jgi:hypothetical protein